MQFIALENNLVELQPLNSKDFEALFSVACDKEIWAQHPDSNRYTMDGFTAYFNKLLKTDIAYLIIDKESNHIIGATSYYQYDKEDNSVAIGYTFLAKSYWGGQYNQSIKQLMIEYAFNFVDKVVFHVREKNFRSQAALAKLGATKVKEYPAPADTATLQLEFHINKAKQASPDKLG